MKKALVIVFFTIHYILSIPANKTWSESEITTEINKEHSQKQNFLYDPYEHTGTFLDTIINEYFPIVLEKATNFYFIIIYNTSSNFNADLIRQNYNYTSSEEQEKSIFIVFGFISNSLYFSIGNSLKLSQTYLNDVKIKSLQKYQSYYKNMFYRELIIGFRNAFIIPENYWTPDQLGSRFISEIGICDYYFYDFLLTAGDINSKLNEYFNEFIEQNVHVYIFPVTRVNNEYSSKENIKKFLNELVYKLDSSSINVKSSVIGLYVVWDGLFALKIGDNLGGDLKESEFEDFKATSTYWENLDVSYVNFMKNTRFYVVGNRIGWTGIAFAKYIQSQEESDFNYLFFDYDIDKSDNITVNERYVDGILFGLYKQNNMHSIVLYFNKIGKNETFSSFVDNFFKTYTFKSHDFNKNKTMVMIVEGSNKKREIIMGKEILDKRINSSQVEEIKAKSDPIISQGKFMNAIKEMLKWIRYETVINGMDFTPTTFAYYFNDFYERNNYYFYQQEPEVFSKEEISSNLNDYFERMAKNKTYVFVFSFEKIHDYFEKQMKNFTEQLVSNISDSHCIISPDNSRFIVVIFHRKLKLFRISPADFIKQYLGETEIKSILLSTEKENKISSFKNILKYLRYYTVIKPCDWTVENILDYIDDFIGESKGNMFFDPNNICSSSFQKDKITALFNSIGEKNFHIFFFNLKYSGDYIYEDNILKDLINKFNYPENVNKNNSLFVDFYYSKRKIFFELGNELEKLISKEAMNKIINDSLVNYLDSRYDTIRSVALSIRKELFKIENWTGKKMASHYNKNYPISYDYCDIVDLSIHMEEKNESTLLENIKKEMDKNGNRIYIFILDEIDSSETIDKFTEILFNEIDKDHIDDKDLSNLIVYEAKSKEIGMYQGESMKNYITNNTQSKIIKYTKSRFTEHFDILNCLVEQIDKHSKIYTPDEIKLIVESDEDYNIFDPQIYLSNDQEGAVVSQVSNALNCDVHYFIFILPKISSPENIDEFLNHLFVDFPASSSAMNEAGFFILYVKSTSQVAIYQHNAKKYKGNANINKIKKESIDKFNKGIYEGIDYIIKEISGFCIEKKGGTSKLWKIFSFVSFGIVVICVAVIVLMRMFKKKKIVEGDLGKTFDINTKLNETLD